MDRVLRVVIFYFALGLSAAPIAMMLIGFIGMIFCTRNEFFGFVIYSSLGYVYNLGSVALSGILVPLYVYRLNKLKDWTNLLLVSLFLISLVMTLLFYPIMKFISLAKK